MITQKQLIDAIVSKASTTHTLKLYMNPNTVIEVAGKFYYASEIEQFMNVEIHTQGHMPIDSYAMELTRKKGWT